MGPRRLRWLFASLVLITAKAVWAHDLWVEPERFRPGSGDEMRPAVAHLVIGHSVQYRLPDNQYMLAIVANMEAVLAGLAALPEGADPSAEIAEYSRLRELPPDELRKQIEAQVEGYLDGIMLVFDGARAYPGLIGIKVPPVGDVEFSRRTTLLLVGTIPAGAEEVTFRYAARYGGSVLRVDEADKIDALWLKDGQQSIPYAISEGFQERTVVDVLYTYMVLGFTHILPKGPDHVLFVFGLFLLSTSMRALLIQVTAFTAAHTLTLALAVYGIVSVPQKIVEPLIAASIACIALENILTPRLKPWRVWVVFGFGLLHGLGFAGVLEEVGLPRDQLLPALASFNIGVELGQLAVITLAFLAVGIGGRNQAWYRPRIVIPASATIAVVATFWTVQRLIQG